MTDLVTQSARTLFARQGAHRQSHDAQQAASWSPELWQAIEDAGLPLALLTEDQGGFGLSPEEACIPLRIGAEHAAPAPLAETMLANWLLARAGHDPLDGPMTVVFGQRPAPFGRYAGHVLHVVGADVSLISAPPATAWRHGTTLDGAPYDTLTAGSGTAGSGQPLGPVGGAAQAVASVLRVQQLTGAMTAALRMSVTYATERAQFGRPISKFQAIQQYLAIMADEAAAAGAAAEMAAAALSLADSAPERMRLIAAAAKLRAGEAAGRLADLAHQVHGAIGFSEEYPLHPLTRRLWTWRDLNGSEAECAAIMGTALSAQQSRGLWPQITELQESFF